MNPQSHSFISYKKLIVPANSSRSHAVTGQAFICIESSDKFTMSIDDNEKFQWEVGIAFRLFGDDFFKRLTFYNETDSDIELEFYAGNADISDARLNILQVRQLTVGVKNISTIIVPGDDTSLAATTAVTCLGTLTLTPGATPLARKAIIVTNTDQDNDLQLLTSDDDVFATVFVRTAWTSETDDTIKIYNPNAVAVDYNLAQIYYGE